MGSLPLRCRLAGGAMLVTTSSAGCLTRAAVLAFGSVIPPAWDAAAFVVELAFTCCACAAFFDAFLFLFLGAAVWPPAWLGTAVVSTGRETTAGAWYGLVGTWYGCVWLGWLLGTGTSFEVVAGTGCVPLTAGLGSDGAATGVSLGLGLFFDPLGRPAFFLDDGSDARPVV